MRRMRRDCLAPDMVGKRFGSLLVLTIHGVRRFGTKSVQYVRTICDCGKFSVMPAHVIRAGRRSCRKCAIETVADLNRVRLSDGTTLAELSRKSGVSMDALYQRRRRGWPEDRLAEGPAYKGRGG